MHKQRNKPNTHAKKRRVLRKFTIFFCSNPKNRFFFAGLPAKRRASFPCCPLTRSRSVLFLLAQKKCPRFFSLLGCPFSLFEQSIPPHFHSFIPGNHQSHSPTSSNIQTTRKHATQQQWVKFRADRTSTTSSSMAQTRTRF